MPDSGPDTGIGASVKRKEDFRFLTGQGRFTDDIDRPGQVHAYFVRSPHAHARIKGIDKAAAEQAPGVIAVFTGADMAADNVAPCPAAGWSPTATASRTRPRHTRSEEHTPELQSLMRISYAA